MTHPQFHPNTRFRERGQTIVIALIVLGLLLILGFVFLGIINKNIQSSGRQQNRSEANDLAEAGARYAHSQLLHSEAGADWFGSPTGPVAASSNPASGLYLQTGDPDALYLRGPAMTSNGTGLVSPKTGTIDLGGPDGLGPFFRWNTTNGRALIRVRYAPSDANIFANTPTGPLRNPGTTRNYIVIESVGRVGRIDPNDPTSFNQGVRRQFRTFASQAAFESEFALMTQGEAKFANNRRVTAFVALGITDAARSIVNTFGVSRAAEIGIPSDLPVQYKGQPVGQVLRTQIGTPNANLPGAGALQVGAYGSLYANADLKFFGQIDVYANATTGDRLVSSGGISGDEDSQLTIHRRELGKNPLAWKPEQVFNLLAARNSAASFDSYSSRFSTADGTLIDGFPQTDAAGYSRGAGVRTPPNLFITDPETGESRYVQMTKESGVLINGQNSGQGGHGRGLYVNNFSDRQTPSTEAGRQAVGEDQSLAYDWLNPNNGQSKSGWVGPYYVPVGAVLNLTADGFTITRDSRGAQNERTWRTPDGVNTNSSTIRYRLGRGTSGLLMIVNTFTPGIGAIAGQLGAADYDRGMPFNGVLYFEGNVRVRGVVPTDVQISVVSGASIYIEGSITKGVTGNDLTAAYQPSNGDPIATARGSRISGRLSRSLVGLFAKDYVTVNTTMFFGPDGRQTLEAVQDTLGATSLNPIRMKQDGAIGLDLEFALNPNAGGAVDPTNPTSWPPFPVTYADAKIPANRLNTKLLVTHAMDDGPGNAAIISMNVNDGVFDTPTSIVSAYGFPNTQTDPSNTVFDGSASPTIPAYGLGVESYQKFPKFESIGLDLVKPATTNLTADLMTANDAADPNNRYRLFNQGVNNLLIRGNFQNNVPWNDYLLARTAVVPHDIRIEASIYAQEGSFFVIPGPWFNPNPNDRRDTYEADVIRFGGGAAGAAAADDARLTAFGAAREIPFYGEPLDVRVVINGAIAENMPPPMSQQSEWVKKWGWIPVEQGASGVSIPLSHVPAGSDMQNTELVPNFTVSYDPTLATAKVSGFAATTDPRAYVRTEWYDFNNDGVKEVGELIPLPPLPRMPVSPSLAFFGDIN